MPIYEYECLGCGDNFEINQKITDKPMEKCNKCGGNLQRVISNTSFILKGAGWYKTDYASKPVSSDKKKEKTPDNTKGQSEKTSEVTTK